jgi:hypothetical protein
MSSTPNSPDAPRQLSGPVAAATPAPASAPAGAIVAASMPLKQLQELPKDELEHIAEDLGIDSTRYSARQHLVAAIHERRQLIAVMDRDAMLDVIRWGRRPVPSNATKEQLATEIARIKSMRFTGLSQSGLLVLAIMRGIPIKGDEDVNKITKKLKKQEGLFTKLNRKRRAWIGSVVSNMLGDDEAEGDYQFLPPQQSGANTTTAQNVSASPTSREGSIKEEIEEAGLFGGLANRVKRTADSYLNQKLDEIEARIDRKLDEIDRRLAEWRDKEVANRLRILKITLWVSVAVGVVSLIYSYIKVNFPG